MFSRFTTSARRVMQVAFREAKHRQHDFVGTEHILYGLLCDVGGPANALLGALGVPSDRLLDRVEAALDDHEVGRSMEKFPLSPASKRVFQAADEEAASLRHQMIGPEHLLLGLLRDHECGATQLLIKHGLTIAAARAAIASIPPEAYHDAKVQAGPSPRSAPGLNPSAAELERWVSDVVEPEDETVGAVDEVPPSQRPPFVESLTAVQAVEWQLRCTQLAFAIFVGVSAGWWTGGFGEAVALGAAGMALVLVGWAVRRPWAIAILTGLIGVYLGFRSQANFLGPATPVVLGAFGFLMGSFFGDLWRNWNPIVIPSKPAKKPIREPRSNSSHSEEPP